MIRLKHVTKVYGTDKTAIRDISLEIKKGERIVLLGTSGSGKTTILRMINRLIEPTSGQIWINDIPITQQKPALLRRQLGYVIQQHGLFPHYTVAENIAVVPKLLGWTKERISRRIEVLMEKFHISDQTLRNAYPSELSGGQKQRVGLARALAAAPPILLMDEPFGALDPITRISVRNELLRTDELKDKTVVLVTHDTEEAIAFADRICLLDQGCVQQIGSASELLLKPANDFTYQFFTHNRFELELKTVRLTSLWNYFSDEIQPKTINANNTSLLPIKSTLWEAFTCLVEKKDTERQVIVRNEGKNRRIRNVNELTNAFKKYKEQYSNERTS
ncbi:ATP-binding cassette domain-containing protein [Olivibacter sp. SDN3]|uniref:ATP-binding cassette domain-containing protein n=1 Tax=Olivibacter sp. SDN3 TaxID=2764720 RepID=UPI001650E434|nr:ATP-binding cassette domain-containing protein [Olivibacter sp. SDN3]QNL49665.1 ATP-binding cassette domain-containing protein [Olivibacter sp. SDN3]